MGNKPEADEETLKFIAEQEALMNEGHDLIKRASDEALEYVADAVENINDKAWRKMAMSSQAVEMGIGVGMAEYLLPVVYADMDKSLHKRLKISKDTARALRHIYIGRVIKNVRKELNGRDR